MVRTIPYTDTNVPQIIARWNWVQVKTPEARAEILQHLRECGVQDVRDGSDAGRPIVVPADLDEYVGTDTDDHGREVRTRMTMWEATRRAGGIIDVTGEDNRDGSDTMAPVGMTALAIKYGRAGDSTLGIRGHRGWVLFDFNDGWTEVETAINAR